MNYLPYVMGWFYGAADAESRASWFTSWGLLSDAPEGAPPTLPMWRGYMTMVTIPTIPTVKG